MSDDREFESSDQQNIRGNLLYAFLLFSTFSLCELFVGWHFNSVALVSDAAAMIIDSLSFILNYFAVSYVHEYSVWAKIVAPLLSLSILYILVFFFFLPDAMDQIWGKVPVEDQFQLPILDILFPIINAIIDVLVLYRFLPKLNVNDMNEVSAAIHAWADTGRTVSVGIAGLVAELFSSLSPDYCDGW
jgi:Co/Zn/Cd efflux system component